MNRRQLMMLAGGLPLMSTAYAQTQAMRRSRPGDPSWPSAAQWQELNARVGGQLVQVKPPLDACRGGAGQRRVRRLLQRPEEPLADRRQRRADPDQRLGRCLDVDAQRLCRGRAQRGRRRGRGQLRAHPSPAAGREGRRPQLSGDVERAGFAAGVDARHEPHRAARRLRRPGLQRSRRSRRCRWAPAWCGCTPTTPSTKAGRYVQGGGCTTVGVAGLIQSGGFGSFSKRYGTGGGRPARGRGGDGRRHGAHRQRLHQPGPVLGA